MEKIVLNVILAFDFLFCQFVIIVCKLYQFFNNPANKQSCSILILLRLKKPKNVHGFVIC